MNAQNAGIAIVGIPFDANSSYLRGAAGGPEAIRRALHCDSSNLWTESGIDVGAAPLSDLPDLKLDEVSAFRVIEESTASILEQGMIPVSLGGDHSITYPILRAFGSRGAQISILHFDAHPDLYDQLQGNRFSHACPFARIMEERLATRLVQVGIRTANAHQRKQAERFGVEMIEMRDYSDDILVRFDTPVYVSVDLDVLDPAFAPGVSHHEPGGLSTRQLIQSIQNIRAPIAGVDIVELNPSRDPSGITAMAAAKVLKELIAAILGNTNHRDTETRS